MFFKNFDFLRRRLVSRNALNAKACLKGRCFIKIMKTVMNLIITLALLTVIILSCFYIMYGHRLRYPAEWTRKIYKPFSTGLHPNESNIEFYNLVSPLVNPKNFKCVRSSTSPAIDVCVYDTMVDEFITRDLETTGIWEPDITRILLEVLNSDETSVFIDIGANIGYYALLAARLGHATVAVEPVLDHVWRIHRAVELGHLEGSLIILKNAVADRRILATVRKSGNNQGDSQIEMEVKECQGSCPPTVKTIALNDLTYLTHDLSLISTNQDILNNAKVQAPISLNEKLIKFRRQRQLSKKLQNKNEAENLKRYKNAPANVVLKIDSQGFEHKTFSNPDAFFDRNSVSYVFMEWYNMARSHTAYNKSAELPRDRAFAGQKDPDMSDMIQVEIMMRFLSERNFHPYSVTRPTLGEPLNPAEWHHWPHDIVWCHDSQSFFMIKMAIRSFFN